MGKVIAEFVAHAHNWNTGVDGIAKLELRIPIDEKYNAFPVQDKLGIAIKWTAELMVGDVDISEKERTEAIKRLLQGSTRNSPFSGKMGDGTGAKGAENRPDGAGYGETSNIESGKTVRSNTPQGRRQGGH